MSYAVYVYADANKVQQKVRADEINWTGTWASTGTYFASTWDSVLYSNDRYVAVTDNVGVNPTAKLPNKRPNPFSLLVTWQAGDEPPFSDPTPSQDDLWRMASTGTVLAGQAYSLAAVGTNVGTAALVTAVAAGSLASQALTVAYQGTAAANQALTVAYYGTATANQALVNSWAGTAAQAAIALGVSGTVWAAFQPAQMPDTRLIFTNGILTALEPSM